jgi:hypothetical protein
MYIVLLLSIACWGGFTSAAIAHSRHHRQLYWFVLGFCFPLPAVLFAYSWIPRPRPIEVAWAPINFAQLSRSFGR